MKQKGVHPCSYMDSFNKFDEKLQGGNEFYSILQNEHVSNEQYKHAQNVWIHSIARQSVSIMICILNQIFFCLLMYLRISEILVCYIINLIHVIILHFLNCLGMLYWKINEWYEIIINDSRWYVSIYWQRSEGWYLIYFKHNSHPSNHWNTLR